MINSISVSLQEQLPTAQDTWSQLSFHGEVTATRRCLAGTPRDPIPEPQLPQPCAGHSLSHPLPGCTVLGEAPRQLAGSEIEAHHYLCPDKFNSGPVNLDRTINTCRTGLSRFGMGTYLSKFPLSPSSLFTPLPTFSDLYPPKKGQSFTLLFCSWSAPYLRWYKQVWCRQGLNLTESSRWFSDHIPDWLLGSKGNGIYCTKTRQQQQLPLRSLWSFMQRNKKFQGCLEI